MFFDFCVGKPNASGQPYGLDTIYWIWGDASYQTPRKFITPGKTYIVFTTKGEGFVSYDGLNFRVGEGQALAMRPTHDFGYGCPGDTWHFWWFELCQPQMFLETERVLSLTVDAFVLRLFKQGLICAKQDKWRTAQSLLVSALMLMQDSADQASAASGSSTIYRAEQYVRENLKGVTVASLCDELGMQERTLRNLCHRTLAYSPKLLISRIRLETAQQLLVNTTMPIHMIAAELGFSSQFHFSKSFKEHFRITPSEYRKQSGL